MEDDMKLRDISAAVCLITTLCSAVFLLPANADGVKIEQKVAYLGSPNNIKMSNGVVELIIATDYGPRIMRYAMAESKDDDNVFATIPPDKPTLHTEYGDWFIRGGHRLWHSPEAVPRTYETDNDPVQVTIEGSTVKLAQPIEKHTQILKEIWITLDPTGSRVTVVHRLTNKGTFALEMAGWAMSAMNKGGKAIIPQEPFVSHEKVKLPARPVVLWPYTNMKDPRWMFGTNFITLQQDVTNNDSQKLGVFDTLGWAGYSHAGALFLKRYSVDKSKPYPDYNSNTEIYTDGGFLELETLSPLQQIAPDQTLTHTERWWLFNKVDLGSGEAGIAAALQPILSQTEKELN